jgi:putative glycosyl hydrolase
MAAGPGRAGDRAHRLLAAATGAVALLATAATAQAAVVGLADQQPGSYGDPRVQALGLRYARLTVPWDAATSEPQAVATWLAAVSAAGMAPHVAFEHLAGDRCPGRPCTTPTAAQYGAAIRRFVARFPQVRTYTTWNEANHASQPVADDPEAVAAYYDELRAACAACTIVAGDVLDSGSYRRWLERFLRASTTTPRLWGLHDYGDVTYGRTTGVDTVLGTVPGRLWIEETGGLVAIRNAAGRQTLAVDEAVAARAIDRAFAIAAANPRIARMYVYQWRANPGDRFDAGLVRPDSTARPSYAALARDLAAQAAVRWKATWSTRRAGRLLLRAICTTSTRVCRGRVTVSSAGRRLAVRAYRTSARHPTAGVHVDVPRALRARRRIALVVRAAVPSFPAQTLTVTTPTTRR